MTIIRLEQVSKRYRLSGLGSKSIRDECARLVRRLTGRSGRVLTGADDFFALSDVSLEVEAGQTVGLIGPNGSGKSTILKLLSRITYPTSGTIAVHGSVASLIEVGAGFHPELTGRENIYLYGSIMGMRRSVVRSKFDRIVEFAELERFIDTPVKRYSSGMYVRLGFAVAAHVNPRILLVDEVLAVGDAAFQRKCLSRVEALRRGGMTILFVSHNMAAVERLCDRVFFLHQGRLQAEGDPQEVIQNYYGEVVLRQNPSAWEIDDQVDSPHIAQSGRDAEISSLSFVSSTAHETDEAATGEPLVARIAYRAYRRLAEPVFELLFYSMDGQLHCHFSTAAGERLDELEGEGVLELSCDELGLAPGLFRVDVALVQRGALTEYDRKQRARLLKVRPGKAVRGLFHSPHRWRLLPQVPPSSEVDRAGQYRRHVDS